MGENIMQNVAEAESMERIHCNHCDEPLVFHMKDKDHEFAMGLSTVLQCLEAAILDGALPKLPSDWCYEVGSAYGMWLEEEAQDYRYKKEK